MAKDDATSPTPQSDMEVEEDHPTDNLVQGRARRTTAGRNMSALINAEADDDLNLLFAEIEDDNDFSMGVDGDAAEMDDDMALESDSDDEDDQGPNAQDGDLEGEKELEKQAKAENKKRRAQEGLKLQALRKKVKIDPTAAVANTANTTTPVSRPRKKSERISWLPTSEEGPTRSSSRRQTMQNKKVTHAKLKDSEEKRVRLIASMEEAARKKALHKPKEMTQEERLAEAERVERLNSKSLNRWEEMEKRKAEERKARIEALQNRQLEGPVMSRWSGIATWTNGVLTRIGNVDVIPKSEKEEASRKKAKKPEKEKNGTQPNLEVVIVSDKNKNESVSQMSHDVPAYENPVPAVSDDPEAPTKDVENQQQVASTSDKKDGEITEDSYPAISQPEGPTTQQVSEPESAPAPIVPPAQSPSTSAQPAAAPDAKEPAMSSVLQTSEAKAEKDTVVFESAGEATKENKAEADGKTGGDSDVSAVAAVADADFDANANANTDGATPEKSLENPPELVSKELNPTLTPQGKQDVTSKEPVVESSTSTQPVSDTIPPPPQTPSFAPVSSSAPSITTVPAPEQNEKPASIQPEQTDLQVHNDHQQPAGGEDKENVSKPEAHHPPSKIEHTGRNLIVLENFDEESTRKPEYSIYFNSKKPPKLSKISSSLCVITSLPSRYRDPETSLPYANVYGYREIQRAVSQDYCWSPMLGCYIGPAGVAARGVPERFLSDGGGGSIQESEVKPKGKDAMAGNGNGNGHDTPAAAAPPLASVVPGTPVVAGAAGTPVPPMDSPTPVTVTVETGGAMDVDG